MKYRIQTTSTMPIYAGHLVKPGWHHKACEVLNVGGVSTCIHTQSNNLLQKIIIEYDV